MTMFDDIFDDNLDLGLDDILDLNDTADVMPHGLDDDDFINDVMNDAQTNHDADNGHSEPTFKGVHYTDAEISKMRSDVEHAEYVMKCKANEVHNCEVKLSLNNTKEKIQNGSYATALRHLKEAQSSYNNAVSDYNRAVSRLNHAL